MVEYVIITKLKIEVYDIYFVIINKQSKVK